MTSTSTPATTDPARSALPFSSITETAASWLNEPASWHLEDGALVVEVSAGTDFWRRTHYGFVRDNGHLLAVREPGDFIVTIEVDADCRDRYDQAGLMVRADEEHWLKAGIELDGAFHMSTVVTHERSDWSVTPLEARPDRLALRVTRAGDAVTVEYAFGGIDAAGGPAGTGWLLHRLAWFAPEQALLVGPMAAAPGGAGFTARFRRWQIER